MLLGFKVDSETMTVKVTEERAQNVKKSTKELMERKSFTIRELAKVIGQIVSCFPGVKYGPLFYRNLEQDKVKSLKINRGNFDGKVKNLTKESIEELNWWNLNIEKSSNDIQTTKPTVFVESDASMEGFGAKCRGICMNGRWTDSEKENHINVLELLAVFYALKGFARKFAFENVHIRISCDNTTTVAYLNHMGGSKSQKCNELAKQIWMWCIKRNIWIPTVHLAGILNKDADRESRIFNDDIEWKLNPAIFDKICEKFGKPDIDIFASRLNYQIKPFVS